MRKILCLVTILLLAGCSNTQPDATQDIVVTPTTAASATPATPTPTASTGAASASPAPEATTTNMDKAVREYIFSGQDDLPEAQRLKWAEEFFDRLDLQGLYTQYIADEGVSDDVQAFAQYITDNAPIIDEWRNLILADVEQQYGEKLVRFEMLDGDNFEAYVLRDGKEVPYISGNSRTGYYHS